MRWHQPRLSSLWRQWNNSLVEHHNCIVWSEALINEGFSVSDASRLKPKGQS
jgi:hypothetical protein